MNLIKVLLIVFCLVEKSLSIGNFIKSLLDQISESDSASITTLTILRIYDVDDKTYSLIEDDMVHDIVTKVQLDYSVFYPQIMLYNDRFQQTNRLGSLTVLISDLWEKKVRLT